MVGTKKRLNKEDEQTELLQMRACLGQWEKDRSVIKIKDRDVTPQMDLRQFEITEMRGAYQASFVYNVTTRDAKAKIKTLQQSGYKLTIPQYPQLNEFYRNGKPITAMDILEDGINEIKVEKDTRTGLEFLFDTYND